MAWDQIVQKLQSRRLPKVGQPRNHLAVVLVMLLNVARLNRTWGLCPHRCDSETRSHRTMEHPFQSLWAFAMGCGTDFSVLSEKSEP
jgi:hypothetical protein